MKTDRLFLVIANITTEERGWTAAEQLPRFLVESTTIKGAENKVRKLFEHSHGTVNYTITPYEYSDEYTSGKTGRRRL